MHPTPIESILQRLGNIIYKCIIMFLFPTHGSDGTKSEPLAVNTTQHLSFPLEHVHGLN